MHHRVSRPDLSSWLKDPFKGGSDLNHQKAPVCGITQSTNLVENLVLFVKLLIFDSWNFKIWSKLRISSVLFKTSFFKSHILDDIFKQAPRIRYSCFFTHFQTFWLNDTLNTFHLLNIHEEYIESTHLISNFSRWMHTEWRDHDEIFRCFCVLLKELIILILKALLFASTSLQHATFCHLRMFAFFFFVDKIIYNKRSFKHKKKVEICPCREEEKVADVWFPSDKLNEMQVSNLIEEIVK